MKTPTTKNILSAFMRICENHPCEKCPIKNYRISSFQDNIPYCSVIFTHAVLTGKLGLNGKPVAVSKTETTTPTCSKTEQVAKPALPTWCKEGAWVMRYDNTLLKIVGIYDNGNVDVSDTFDGSYTPVEMSLSNLRPVRFRPYTFEEAKALIGKTMRYVKYGGTKGATLITHVEVEEDINLVTINGRCFSSWANYDATIDGVPFGVPEIDTEAEKEAQE